ncbi:MAG: metal ABC transporter ATP-binding protein [Lachnospiraceae bacterium]|nr:metal ABC transporter ATP-binding protein [Lachnospiraceae bacterium]
MPLIEAENLILGYERRAIAEGISFTVNKGDYICIVGENGSGKSTLMKTLLGLTAPLDGTFRFGDNLRKNEIGYLPQQTVVQKDFPASVTEIVLSGFEGRKGLRPFYTREEKETARRNMDRMGITHLAGSCYRNLSGGQQQRVLLARALCATERVLLLDEPVSGLDPKVTVEMYELISRLNHEGITIIMVSHDVAAALKYASHILHIGDTVFFGTRDEYVQTSEGKLFIERSSNTRKKEDKRDDR